MAPKTGRTAPTATSSSRPSPRKGRKAAQHQPPFTLSSSGNFAESWESVISLLKGRSRICVLTGAGMSVSCGIPDFRSQGSGLYATLNTQELGLSCPEELFDVHFFDEDPRPFYRFARQLYFPLATDDTTQEPPRVLPSDSHKLLALLEQKKMLLRVYSQNIDGLEEEAGVSAKKICYAHGSLQWAFCRRCKCKVPAKDFEHDILAGRVARCQVPGSVPNPSRRVSSRKRLRESSPTRGGEGVCGGVLKPGVTFFGEALSNTVKTKLEADRDKVDALVVIGTSLSVSPISKVIDYLPPNIPRILINKTIVAPPLNTDDDTPDDEEADFREGYVFDAYLLGFCDSVVRALVHKLFSPSQDDGDDECLPQGELLSTMVQDESNKDEDSPYAQTLQDWKAVTVPQDRVFLFAGAQPPTGNADELKYHEVAQCDGCHSRIKGTIQKCQQCFDFDLCHSCFELVAPSHFEGTHSFSAEAPAAT